MAELLVTQRALNEIQRRRTTGLLMPPLLGLLVVLSVL